MKDTEMFDAIAHIDEDLVDRCLAEDEALREKQPGQASSSSVVVTEVKPRSARRIIAAVLASAAALLLVFGLISALHIGGRKPIDPASTGTDAPTAAPTEAPTAAPLTDTDRLRAFFETADANGVKNGEKLFPNYDPNNPGTWEMDWGQYKKLTFDEEGRLTDLEFRCDIDSPVVLAGDLDLNGFEALRDFWAVGCQVDGRVIADNIPSASANGMNSLLIARASGEAVYRGCYLDTVLLRSDTRTVVEVRGVADDEDWLSPDILVEVNVVGSEYGYAGVSAWSNSDYYSVNLSAEAAQGGEFLGWYDESGELVSRQLDYRLISDPPETRRVGEREEYRFTAKFCDVNDPNKPTPEPIPDADALIDRAFGFAEPLAELHSLYLDKSTAKVERVPEYWGYHGYVVRIWGHDESFWHIYCIFKEYGVNGAGETETRPFLCRLNVEEASDLLLLIGQDEFDRMNAEVSVPEQTITVTRDQLRDAGYAVTGGDEDYASAALYCGRQLAARYVNASEGNILRCRDSGAMDAELAPWENDSVDAEYLVGLVFLPEHSLEFAFSYGDCGVGYFIEPEGYPEYAGYFTYTLNVLINEQPDGSMVCNFMVDAAP